MTFDFVKLVREHAKEATAFEDGTAAKYRFKDGSELFVGMGYHADLLATTILNSPLPSAQEAKDACTGETDSRARRTGSVVSQLEQGLDENGTVLATAFFIFNYDGSIVGKIVVAGLGREDSKAAEATSRLHVICSNPLADANSAYWVDDEFSA